MNDYDRGLAQFRKMVGDDRIDALIERFRSVCPDFENEVVSVVGGRIWTRPGIDLKTRSLCSICHRVGRFGGTLGPDLSTIGQVRSRRDLLEAIVFPSATFARGYEPVQIETSNGETFHGIIGEQKNDAVFLGLPDGSKREIARASITATSLSEVSPMPPGMDHVLTSEELKSLLAYLASLGGEEK